MTVAERLLRYERLERTYRAAMRGWHRSTRTSPGDPRHLEDALEALELIRGLFGLQAHAAGTLGQAVAVEDGDFRFGPESGSLR